MRSPMSTSLAGYAAMSVEQITGTAGVSRRTFYDAFTSKEDAFLAALDSAIRRLVQRVRRAYRDSDTFPGGRSQLPVGVPRTSSPTIRATRTC